MSKPAAAQVDSYRFGYQFLRSSCNGCDGVNIPLGFFGDVSGKLGASVPMLDWVGQVTFGHKSDSVAGVNISSNLVTIGGGVRYGFASMSSGIKPHVQGLVLLAHSSSSSDDITVGGVTIPGVSASENKPGIEISAAVDIPMNNGWMATAGAGLQRIFFEGTAENEFVVRVGVAHKIGK
jgi:hypothetical protein